MIHYWGVRLALALFAGLLPLLDRVRPSGDHDNDQDDDREGDEEQEEYLGLVPWPYTFFQERGRWRPR